MNTFFKLVKDDPELPQKLMKRLRINATNISNVKSGRRNMPSRWMPHVVELSNGKATYEQLVADNLKRKKKLAAGLLYSK